MQRHEGWGMTSGSKKFFRNAIMKSTESEYSLKKLSETGFRKGIQ